jgi:hypothetical protein
MPSRTNFSKERLETSNSPVKTMTLFNKERRGLEKITVMRVKFEYL